MYNPYQTQPQPHGNEPNDQPSYWNGNHLDQQQQQQQQQQQSQQQQAPPPPPQQQQQNSNFGLNNGAPFNQFFNDPTTQMGLHFSQSAFNASQNYMQQNIGQLVSTNDIKYYFKVSNAYVLKKLLLILFPYTNKGWSRQLKNDSNINNNNNGNAIDVFATPIEDINAPDLYIPTMSFLSYILVWALDEGVKGDFHPEMLGYATTRTLAFYIMDFILLRISFYVIGINSRNSKLWDLVSYTGYKFVPILAMLLIGILTDRSIIIRYLALAMLIFSHGFFLMRSLKYVVLPGGGQSGESRIRIQYLFVYCFIVQGLFMWLMC